MLYFWSGYVALGVVLSALSARNWRRDGGGRFPLSHGVLVTLLWPVAALLLLKSLFDR